MYEIYRATFDPTSRERRDENVSSFDGSIEEARQIFDLQQEETLEFLKKEQDPAKRIDALHYLYFTETEVLWIANRCPTLFVTADTIKDQDVTLPENCPKLISVCFDNGTSCLFRSAHDGFPNLFLFRKSFLEHDPVFVRDPNTTFGKNFRSSVSDTVRAFRHANSHGFSEGFPASMAPHMVRILSKTIRKPLHI